jgi:uncharacterized protein (TIGR00369 family)
MTDRLPAPPAPLDGYIIYDPVDAFENLIGPFFWKLLEDGTNHVILQSDRRHGNRQGYIHGGLLLTMMDLAFSIAAKEHPDQRLVTISLSSEFVAAGEVGNLIEARTEVVRKTRSLCFLRGQISSQGATLVNASCIYKYIRSRA